MKSFKLVVISVLILFGAQLKGQMEGAGYWPAHGSSYSNSNFRSPTNDIQDILDSFIKTHSTSIHPQSTFYLINTQSSSTGIHYTFEQHILGTQVLHSFLKFHLNGNSVFAQAYLYGNIKLDQASEVFAPSVSSPKEYYWFYSQGRLKLMHQEFETDHGLLNIQRLVSLDKNEVVIRDLNQYLHASDSLIWVKVFYPDPITSIKEPYGVSIKDWDDSTYAAIENQQVFKSIQAQFKNDTFFLANEYIKIVDISGPYLPVAVQKTDTFSFLRNEHAFEEVNVYYHITNFRQHMSRMGYDSLCNYQIWADARALGGVDNSIYANNFSPPRLLFGIGGVDDGEDCSPIIHEYTHALSDAGSPNSNFGKHRAIIDEGIGDYLAASYKKDIDPYQSDRVYNWDGHNEFWGGRNVGTTKIYPRDTFGTIHGIGEIISSSLMDINKNLGRTVADQLTFESLYYLAPNMSMQAYGETLLQIEAQLFGEKYKSELCRVLYQRGLITHCEVSAQNQVSDVGFAVSNTYGFALGISPLKIESKEPFLFSVYNLNGVPIMTRTTDALEVEVAPSELPTGTHILRIESPSYILNLKLTRFN
ncbi:MAG: hypothetical protein KDC83_01500 [Flavobacteriales bacterium]|nr:hypothetical protein [Flavobacteriales bacterium]